VAAAHAHGIVHRDIKPENLMVTGDDQIKVLDFGVAQRVASPDRPTMSITSTATEAHANLVAGTPHYMAPEAHYGGRIDERTDIFSLGVVFYELLAGVHPFGPPDAPYEAVLDRVMNTVPAPLTDLRPEVGEELSALIARTLAKDPSQRISTCAELADDLRRVRALAPATIASRAPDPGQGRARTIRAAGLAAGALLAVAAAILWWTWTHPALPRERILTVLAPVTPGADEDFASFALGATERLASRLRSRQTEPGFQTTPFQEGLDEKVASPEDARRVLGANLALVPTLEEGANAFRARLELWDTHRRRMLGARVIEHSRAKPFEFLERVDAGAASLSGLAPGRGPRVGVRGAGTLRFLLQGIGRLRRGETEPQVRMALADLELACRTEPEAAEARAWLALGQHKLHLVTHDAAWLDRAEASAREAVGLDSACAAAHSALATALATRRDFPASLAELQRTCALDPNDDDSRFRLARTYGRVGRDSEEKEVYLAEIARRPHCGQPYWWLAVWHFRRGQVEESIAAVEQMIQRSPDLYRGYASLGGVLVLHGDYGRAIDTLKHSIALRPTKAAFDNLGTAYFNCGRLGESVDAYNQAFQFGFADYQSWLNLGDAYFWLRNRRDQAREAYAQSVRLAREESVERSRKGRSVDVMIPANLATVFPKLDMPDSARASLRIALRADSANSMVQYCAALTQWQLGERAQAIAWLARAVHGGYPVVWLRDSPIFRSWRSEADFRALIADAAPASGKPSPEGGRK
jgi:tetratricopeptide (TPR) repeat protein